MAFHASSWIDAMDGSTAVTEAGCGRAPGFEPGRETEKDSLAQREPVTFVLFCSFLLFVSFFFFLGGGEKEPRVNRSGCAGPQNSLEEQAGATRMKTSLRASSCSRL